jgi:hypothetical protein
MDAEAKPEVVPAAAAAAAEEAEATEAVVGEPQPPVTEEVQAAIEPAPQLLVDQQRPEQAESRATEDTATTGGVDPEPTVDDYEPAVEPEPRIDDEEQLPQATDAELPSSESQDVDDDDEEEEEEENEEEEDDRTKAAELPASEEQLTPAPRETNVAELGEETNDAVLRQLETDGYAFIKHTTASSTHKAHASHKKIRLNQTTGKLSWPTSSMLASGREFSLGKLTAIEKGFSASKS